MRCGLGWDHGWRPGSASPSPHAWPALGRARAPRGCQEAALLERGRTLVEGIAGCGNCHTPKGPGGEIPGMALAGGFVIEEPNAFRAVVPNITPDIETGIGAWSDAQVALAIREGRRPDGSLIGPPMPIELYRGIADRDLAAMVVYLRSVPPVRNAVTRKIHLINSRCRPPMAPPSAWCRPRPRPPSPAAPISPARSAIASNATRRWPAGGQRDWSRTGAGGPPLATPFGPVVPRNITPHRTEGIGAWTDDEIRRAITEGISLNGHQLSPPMGYAYYARMRRADLDDVVAYLRSLPALP